MSLRKMSLLASMAMAVIAFAAPAAAQATLPHFNGAQGSPVEESYEGFLTFHRAGAPLTGTFGCEVTVTVKARGGTTADITEFAPTTGTCEGTGLFEGCELTNHTSNVPFFAHTTTNHEIVVKDDDTSDIQIHNFYQGCVFGITTTNLEFGQVAVHPTTTGGNTLGNIYHLAVSGTDTSGAVTVDGSVTAEGAEKISITTP